MLWFKQLPEFERIVPIFAVVFLRSDIAVSAQTTQQPAPVAPPIAVSDPITTYAMVGTLLLTVGNLFLTGFRGYLANLSKRSDIELRAQESQNQRSQDIATTMMKQQEVLVTNMMENQKNDRLELTRLITQANEAQAKTTHALETLTELVRTKF